jgi:ATP-dependent Clp protease adaptor protein ClpS
MTVDPGTRPQDIDETSLTNGSGGYIVIVYDNDKNTIEEVVEILIQATACLVDEAVLETWEVHHLGKSVVHHGAQEECRQVAAVIRTIGIRVEVVEE